MLGKLARECGSGTRKGSRPSKGAIAVAVSKVSSEDSIGLRADPTGDKRAGVFIPLNQSVLG